MDIIARARSFIGVIIAYSMSNYDLHTADCTEFWWRVRGLPKNHGGKWWNTDAIWHDAQFDQEEFEVIAAADVQPGDSAVYPSHKDGAGVGHAGHIAFVVDPATHTIIDCSASQNGVHEHVDLLAHFWTKPGAIFVRYKGDFA